MAACWRCATSRCGSTSQTGSRHVSSIPRNGAQVTHGLADIVRRRLLMIAAAYEDGVDANALGRDPVFKMALDAPPSRRELCSQSTVSRLERLPDVRALPLLGRAMIDLCCGSFAAAPERTTLGLDETLDAVHGGQHRAMLNADCDE